MPGPMTLPSWRWHLAICLGLVVMTLACLGNVCSCAFALLDDSEYVIDNALVHKGLSAESCLETLTAEEGHFWQPIVWLSFQRTPPSQIMGRSPSGRMRPSSGLPKQS